MLTMCDRLRQTRRDRGLTQMDLAVLAGVTRPMINRYERGRAEPKLVTLRKLGDALKVSVGFLITGRE